MSVDTAARDAQIDEIRASVKALCARYGEEYWLKLDATHDYPTEFVRELTQAGFLDGVDSGNLRRRRTGCARGGRDHGRDQPVRRARRRVSRADVRDGIDPAARFGRAEAHVSAEDRVRRIATAELRRNGTDHRHRYDEPEDDRDARRRSLSDQRSEGVDQPGASTPI